MSIFRARRAPAVDGLAGHTDITSDRDRRKLQRAIADGLDRLQALHGEGIPTLELQPLVQVCGHLSYPAWKRGTQKAWAKRGGMHTTRTWPAEISEGQFGVLLLPIRAGRVGTAVGRFPAAAASPSFTVGTDKAGYMDAVLVLLARWINNPSQNLTALLGPPVVEVVQRGAAVERRVEDFGLRWPLPAPDGI